MELYDSHFEKELKEWQETCPHCNGCGVITKKERYIPQKLNIGRYNRFKIRVLLTDEFARHNLELDDFLYSPVFDIRNNRNYTNHKAIHDLYLLSSMLVTDDPINSIEPVDFDEFLKRSKKKYKAWFKAKHKAKNLLGRERRFELLYQRRQEELCWARERRFKRS